MYITWVTFKYCYRIYRIQVVTSFNNFAHGTLIKFSLVISKNEVTVQQ